MMIDRDEMQIRSAFSQIQVDTKSLERKVRENMNTRKIIKPTPFKRTGLVAVASIAFLLFLSVSVYAAAALGVFDRFITERDPVFGEVVAPVEIYTVDQDIRVDVIAAQTFGYNAIMYLSVHDTSGQNRITEYTSIAPMLDIPRDEDRVMTLGILGGGEPLYFDQETGTAYFQIEFQDATAIPNAFEIIIGSVTFETRRLEIDFPITLSNLTGAPTMPNPSHISNLDFPTWCAEYVLVPSMGENFPAIHGDGWISGAAIIDGNLHVQLVTPRSEMTELGGRIANGYTISGVMLTSPDGDWVVPLNQTFLQVDANLRGLTVDEMQDMSEEDWLEWADTARYHLNEVVFPIDVTALDSYLLTLTGMFEHSIAGNWSMTVCTGETNAQMRASTDAVAIGKATIKSITVTPFGVSFSGSIDGGIDEGTFFFVGRSVFVETPDGDILIQEFPSVGFSHMYGEDATFIGFARGESPVNVSEVTAVIIGDIRISVE